MSDAETMDDGLRVDRSSGDDGGGGEGGRKREEEEERGRDGWKSGREEGKRERNSSR